MAISSPTVIQQAGGGSDLMQGLAIAQQGFSTMKQLQAMQAQLKESKRQFDEQQAHAQAVLAEEQRQFNAQGKQFLLQNTGAVSIAAQVNPELVGQYLGSIGISGDTIPTVLSDLQSWMNMDPQQQRQFTQSTLNALGMTTEDYLQMQRQPEGSLSSSAAGPQTGTPQAAPQAASPVAPQFQSMWEPGTGASLTPPPEDPQGLRGQFMSQPPGTRHAAEQERGAQLTEGKGPSAGVQAQQRPEGAPGTRHEAMSAQRQTLLQQLETFRQNPAEGAGVVQPRGTWIVSEEGAFDVMRKANTAIGFARPAAGAAGAGYTGGRTTVWDQFSIAIRAQDWRSAGRILPKVTELKTDADVARVRRAGFVDERGQVTPETLKEYAAWRAIMQHKARLGEDIESINNLTPEDLRTEYFWATDTRLSVSDIDELNNIDVSAADGSFNRHATLEARRTRWTQMIASKAQVDEAAIQFSQAASIPTSELQFRSALPQGQYRRLAAQVTNFMEKVHNSRVLITGEDLQQLTATKDGVSKALGGLLRAIPEADQAAHHANLAATMSAVINNTPGGLAGFEQATNGGYSLEVEAVNMATHLLENNAQRSLAEAGLTIEHMGMLAALYSHGPDSSALVEGMNLIFKGMEMEGWHELSQNAKIRALQDNPLMQFYVEALSAVWGGLLQAGSKPGEWLKTGYIGRLFSTPVTTIVPTMGQGQQQSALDPAAEAVIKQFQ